MIKTIRIVVRTLLLAFTLTLAGCDGTAAAPVPPVPAKPAANPFQAEVTARSYAVRLDAFSPAEARGGSAVADIRIAARGDRVCWIMTRLAGVSAPLFAYIHRGTAKKPGPAVIALASRYRTAGCVTDVAPALLVQIEAHPAGYYLAIHSLAHPLGALRGQL